ncbi:MAG: undecaprenyl-diphosphate phosphatase [Elusimicrobiota bacterium]
MTGFFESLFFGFIQGATEFLPVSSSAHLVFSQKLFGWRTDDILFNVLLHLATLGAVLIFMRKEIFRFLADRRILANLVTSTLATAAVVLPLKGFFEGFFLDEIHSGGFLLVTGLLLFLADRRPAGSRPAGPSRKIDEFKIWEAAIVGIVQGIAVLPGISRSGATICTGIFLGWGRTDAALYSFILSVPSILGAALLKMRETQGLSNAFNFSMIAGMAVALITGLLSLKLLISNLSRGRLRYFACYCWVVGMAVVFLALK